MSIGGYPSTTVATPPGVFFVVKGTAKPAGSKRAFVNRHTGRAAIVDASGAKGKTWRSDVRDAFTAAAGSAFTPWDEPLVLDVTFHFARPKGHFTTKGELSATGKRSPFPTRPPDTTKLVRAVEDALEGYAYRNDALIVIQTARKVWADGLDGAVVALYPYYQH
jgi:Holliday junction resolvase RusA-like endonuclease